MIWSDGMPPYTFHCTVCGKEWLPKSLTDNALLTEPKRHVCTNPTPVV